MFFIRDRKARVFFYLLIGSCAGLLFIIGLCLGRQWKEREFKEKNIVLDEMGEELDAEIWEQEELNEMLITIQKRYAFEQWYYQGEDEYDELKCNLSDFEEQNGMVFRLEDLEAVNFYQDEKGAIYFLPVSMVNKIVEVDNEKIPVFEFYYKGVEKYGLFWCKYFKTEWKRWIYPEPENEYTYFYWVQDINEKLNELHVIGSAKVQMPVKIQDKAFRSELYENEYTDAVVDIVHSYLYKREKYGEYKLYIGHYGVNCDMNSLLNSEYNMGMTVAIIPEDGEVKNGMWWIFRAKDILDENGNVVVETDGGAGHSSPIPYDYYNETYAPRIEMIVNMNRLVIPLTITESDEVKELGCFKDEDDLNTIHYYLKN